MRGAGLRARIAADFLKVDGLEPVTYNEYDGSGGLTLSVPVPKALQRSSATDLELSPEFIATYQITWWHVPLEVLRVAGATPKNQAAIVDELGNVWAVWKVQIMSFRTRYRLTCIKE